jgi:hypothetical protein
MIITIYNSLSEKNLYQYSYINKCDNVLKTKSSNYKKPVLKVCGNAKKLTQSGANFQYSDEYKGTTPYPD